MCSSKGERKKSTRKARMLFLWFSFSLFEPITRASRWPPFAAGYVNERITRDKTNAVRGLLQGSPSNSLIRDISPSGMGAVNHARYLCFREKMTIDGLIVQRGRKFRVFCLHVCACVFQACVGRRVASARKARGLKCANGGAQKPQLLTRPSRSLYVSHLPWWAWKTPENDACLTTWSRTLVAFTDSKWSR